MARDDLREPFLGAAPREYDPDFFNLMMRKVEQHFQNARSSGTIRVSTINISSLPTSATGLKTGDLWNDSGTVKVV
jgi:hypothetical protein